jgi:6-phosphogluconolactonase (cycloisomerase 2 family)
MSQTGPFEGLNRRKPAAARSLPGAYAAGLLLALSVCCAGCTDSKKDAATKEPPEYFYVANSGDGTVSGFALDSGDGTLAEIDGSPFTSAPEAFTLVANPAGRFLYVLAGTGGEVYGHNIDPDTGELSDLANSPFSVATNPTGLKIDPSGSYLYIGHDATPDVISGYEINSKSGDLTEVPGSPVTTDSTDVSAIAIHPKGHFVYTANHGANDVSGYAYQSKTGLLTHLLASPFTAGNQPNAIAVEPTGRFVFLGDDANQISSLYVNTVSGELGLTTPAFITVSAAVALLAGPTGQYLYAAGGTDLHAMTIRHDGVLKNLETQTVGLDLRGLAVDSAGVYLYATDATSGDVLGFSLKDSGNVPAVLAVSPFTAGIAPAGIVMVKVDTGD